MSVDQSRPRTRSRAVSRGASSSPSVRSSLRPRPYYPKPATGTTMVMDQELTIPSWHMIDEEPLRRIKSAPMQREKARTGVEMRAESSARQVAPPPPIPACQLTLDFAPSEAAQDLPPAFYIGSSIPTMLHLIIAQTSSLPHYLNPRLTMDLTGRLHVLSNSQTIISVSVCLAEGLALWKRDAIEAHKLSPEMNLYADPQQGLPGGRFSLPLVVQIPNIRLPPSFESPNGKFAVVYELGVTLSCDNPDPMRGGREILLADASRKFDVLPLTMPTRSPVLRVRELSIAQSGGEMYDGVGPANWSIAPSIPTTTFSPASIIPISLQFTTMESTIARQVIVTISLLQRQHMTSVKGGAIFKQVIAEVPISLRWGRFDLHGNGKTTKLKDMALPIQQNGIWEHGMSTAVWLPGNQHADQADTTLSVDFVVVVEIGWPEQRLGSSLTLSEIPGAPPINHLSPPLTGGVVSRTAIWQGFRGHRYATDIPIIIGSVGEPRDALHYVKWQDVTNHESTVDGQRTQVPREFWGGGHTSEDGWKVAPPTYGDAMSDESYSSVEEIMRNDVVITVI